MSLASATVWEVRPGVGISTAGGGFVAGAAGTDYSTQNSPNSGGADSSTTDAVAVGTTTLTSATAAFGTTIVGNIIYLQGGSGTLAAVRRQVVSRTNATTIVLDAAVAAGTGITMNIGGALDLISTILAAMSTSNIVYVKASGTITITTVMTMPALASSPAIQFIGYTTTRGDGGRVTITTSTNSTDILRTSTSSSVYGVMWENFLFTCTAGTPGNGITALSANAGAYTFVNCKWTGFATAVQGDNVGAHFSFNQVALINCEITASTGVGIQNEGATFILGCYIHGNAGGGGKSAGMINAGSHLLLNSVIYNNTGIGWDPGDSGDSPTGNWCSVQVINCAIINNSGDGLRLAGSATSGIVWNTIFDTNGGYGINMSNVTSPPGTQVDARSNFYRGNSTAARNNFPAGPGDVTGTADPFTNRSGADFSLNSTAGGGAACRGAGFPGVLTIGGTGYADIGPLQHQDSPATNIYYPLSQNITRYVGEEN